jgi:hypothetical protein
MIDFHLRNVAYENHTNLERKDVYQRISKSLLRDLFYDHGNKANDIPAISKTLHDNWEVQPILSLSNEKFITSDNPSIIFCDEEEKPALIYLPAHPKVGIVAYDKRLVKLLTNQINVGNLAALNSLQVYNCVRHVFSDYDLKQVPDDWKGVQNWAAKEKPERWIKDTCWKPSYIRINAKLFEKISFFQLRGNQNSILRDAISKAIQMK